MIPASGASRLRAASRFPRVSRSREAGASPNVGGTSRRYGSGVGMREEIQASAAAHQHLGPGYDTAVAEGLVDRIGEEIDRRVDARLLGQMQAPARPRRTPVPGRIGAGRVFLALGSMGIAIGGTVAVLHPGDNPPGTVTAGQSVLVALIWVVIGIINIANAYRN